MLRELFVHLITVNQLPLPLSFQDMKSMGFVESMAARSLILLLHVYRNRAVPYSRSLFFSGSAWWLLEYICPWTNKWNVVCVLVSWFMREEAPFLLFSFLKKGPVQPLNENMVTQGGAPWSCFDWSPISTALPMLLGINLSLLSWLHENKTWWAGRLSTRSSSLAVTSSTPLFLVLAMAGWPSNEATLD